LRKPNGSGWIGRKTVGKNLMKPSSKLQAADRFTGSSHYKSKLIDAERVSDHFQGFGRVGICAEETRR
jgi:hypothetical protein